MKKLFPPVIMVIIIFVLSACAPAAPRQAITMDSAGSAVDESYAAPGMAPPMPAAMEAAPMAPEFDAQTAATGNSIPDAAQTTVERIVIKNASLSIIVDDPIKTTTDITKLAEDMGGFVVSSNTYQTTLDSGEEVPAGSITVRVPAGRFIEAIDMIKAMVKDPVLDVRSESITGEDVTKEYVDLQSRLKNLEETAATLKEIMGSAKKTEDVMSVYNRLIEINEQIEVLKGQIKFYEESAAMSAITVEVIAQESVKPLTIGRWQPAGVALDAVQALVNTLKFFASAAIWIVILVIPVLLVIFIPIWLLWKLIAYLWKRRKAKTPTLPKEPPVPPSNPTV